MERGGSVYIMTNKYHRVLYVGVTSDLVTRVQQHKQKLFPASFTAKYNCTKLVYYKSFSTIEEAIAEENRMKGGSRSKKIELINSMNQDWDDLWGILKEW